MTIPNLSLKQFQKGNRVLFKKYFEEYYRPLCGFANKFIQDMEASDDIVQEAFLGLWNNREDILDVKAIKNYLYSSVRNSCLNYLRHQKVKEKNQLIRFTTMIIKPDKDTFMSQIDNMDLIQRSDKVYQAVK